MNSMVKQIEIGGMTMLHFPNAGDCVDGHLGPERASVEHELADDRYYEIKVTRCNHCGMPISEEDL